MCTAKYLPIFLAFALFFGAVQITAQTEDIPAAIRQSWLSAYLLIEKADQQSSAGNILEALDLLRQSWDILAKIQQEHQRWNPGMLTFRKQNCRKKIQELESRENAAIAALSREQLEKFLRSAREQIRLSHPLSKELLGDSSATEPVPLPAQIDFLTRLNSENQQFKAENTDLKERLQKLNAQLEQSELQVKAWRQAASGAQKLQQEIQALKNKNEDLDAFRQKAVIELHEQSSQIHTLTQQLGVAKTQLEKELGVAKAELEKELGVAKTQLEKELGVAKAELEKARRENQKLLARKQLPEQQPSSIKPQDTVLVTPVDQISAEEKIALAQRQAAQQVAAAKQAAEAQVVAAKQAAEAQIAADKAESGRLVQEQWAKEQQRIKDLQAKIDTLATELENARAAEVKREQENKALADLIQKAVSKEQSNEWSEAAKIWQRIASARPRHAQTLARIPVLLQQAGEQAQASQALSNYIGQAAGDFDTLFSLGESCLQANQPTYAIAFLTWCHLLNPANIPATAALGMAYAAGEMPEAAESYLRQALALDENYEPALTALAIILATAKPPQKIEARQLYQRARNAGTGANPILDDLLQEP